ncbi:hypothetical protein EYZ11_009317 [Aspergillus tanneri]|uniref:Uncharacterized protein n=1 Tax=Aspergillus tanneri TaxID=1220188 RepID=A0A4S3J858_9EURO|nr:hypothetical protein EYZ11_009317 [Aspergillus tanneri]
MGPGNDLQIKVSTKFSSQDELEPLQKPDFDVIKSLEAELANAKDIEAKSSNNANDATNR